ncbi:MAG TPA: sulfatase [Solirubrobacteraceae bacterium]|nr:sulfatase [Solirubrobacteraceae bacterium]
MSRTRTLAQTRSGPSIPPTQQAPAPGQGVTSPHVPQPPPRAHDSRPNIVFILTDDLSQDLVPYMHRLSALKRHGLAFRNYFVSDSLCCPSRATIFTGNFPHDTGVFTNADQGGGIDAFWRHHDESHVFNLALYRAGYRTAMMGKYLNGYLEGGGYSPVPATYVPAGWSNWDVAGWGYPEYHYTLNQDGTLHRYGGGPRNYLTNVLQRLGVGFINHAAAGRRPFFLEMATFTPHFPYVPAPRDAHRFPGLSAPHPPNWNRLPTHPPSWLQGHPPLSARKIRRIDYAFRRRAQDVQSIDRLLGALEGAVARHHLSRRTYFVFSSDNGYHTGEYRLLPGKLTAFDTDIRVPLIIAGPGIWPGSTTPALAENTDLASTFTSLAGTRFSCDGHSLTPLLRGGPTPHGWRDAVLVEHHGPATSRHDPDRQNFDSGNPTTYEAIRTPGFLYVEYRNGQREFYDLRSDPYELRNVVGNISPSGLARLHAALTRLRHCHTGRSCWRAEHLPTRFLAEVTADSRS